MTMKGWAVKTLVVFIALATLNDLKAKEIRIGFVDVNRVLKEYRDLQNAKNQLNSFVSQWQAQLDSVKHIIDSMKSAYEQEKPMLSDEAKLQKEQEIQQKEEEYKGLWNSIWGPNGQFERKKREIVQPFVRKVDSVITDLAKSLKYDLVLDVSSGVVLYGNTEDDFTDLVIQELNKEYLVAIDTTSIAKPKVAVFPLKEDENARAVNLGTRLQGFIASALENSPRIDLISTATVNDALQREAGPTMEIVDVGLCLRVARTIGADYFVFGEVNKSGEDVLFRLKLYSVKDGRQLQEETGQSADRDVDLMIQAGDAARRLIARQEF